MNEYPLYLVEKLSFVRYGGTLEEARAELKELLDSVTAFSEKLRHAWREW